MKTFEERIDEAYDYLYDYFLDNIETEAGRAILQALRMIDDAFELSTTAYAQKRQEFLSSETELKKENTNGSK